MCTFQTSGDTLEVVGALLVEFCFKCRVGLSLLQHNLLPVSLNLCLLFRQQQPW